MRTTISKLKYLFIIMVIAGLASCEGPIGPIGPDGTAGTDGTDGTDGNANVTSVLVENYALEIGVNDFNVTELTQDIYDNGVVFGYVKVPANSFWETLPYVNSSSNVVSLYIDRIYVGVIRLESTFANGNVNFRFVLIAGEPNKSLNPKQAIYDELDGAGVDVNDYYQVMDYYGLEY